MKCNTHIGTPEKFYSTLIVFFFIYWNYVNCVVLVKINVYFSIAP